jgi:hypothetical protein
MEPLAAYKPPPVNEQTERLFTQVYGALNDIDRRLYPPVETFHERIDEMVAAYEAVGKQFADNAEACGIPEWLRFAIVHRIFVAIIYEVDSLARPRELFAEMERLGYPDIHPLISLRIIWANRLAEVGETNEARAVARQLVADIDAFTKQYPGVLTGLEFEDDIARFRDKHGV